MKTTFACPGCGVSGSADSSLAGREVRCRQCGQKFAIPGPAGVETDGYAIDEPTARIAPPGTSSREGGSAVFVPSRGGEPGVVASPARTRQRASQKSRRDESNFAWRIWLIRIAIAATIILALIALIAPGGVTIAATTLLGIGMVMILVGYTAGAIGAFSEDSLYGCLYLILPLYNAYYLVTRWDDLWRWFLCSTAGVGLVMLGTEMLRWSGAAE